MNTKQKLIAFTGTATFGIGLLNGAMAMQENNEAVRAETIASNLEAQGNPEAAVWHDEADRHEHNRNLLLLPTTMMLGAAALNGTALIISVSRSGEQDTTNKVTVSA